MNKAHQNQEAYVFPPARAVSATLQHIQTLNDNPHRIGWGLECLDAPNGLMPHLPGMLTFVLGRPSHGKTSLLIHLARHALDSLRRSGGKVVFATYETEIEAFIVQLVAAKTGYTLSDVGRGKADLSRMEAPIIQLIEEGFTMFGSSATHRAGRMPNINDLESALAGLIERGEDPRIVFVDYLQQIPQAKGDRSEGVAENVARLKDMAITFQVPFVVAAQADRRVDDYPGVKFPTEHDGQWTSRIEQEGDVVVGISRPTKYLEVGTEVRAKPRKDKGEREGRLLAQISQTSFGIKVLKQRYGETGQMYMVNYDPLRVLFSEPDPLPAEQDEGRF